MPQRGGTISQPPRPLLARKAVCCAGWRRFVAVWRVCIDALSGSPRLARLHSPSPGLRGIASFVLAPPPPAGGDDRERGQRTS